MAITTTTKKKQLNKVQEVGYGGVKGNTYTTNASGTVTSKPSVNTSNKPTTNTTTTTTPKFSETYQNYVNQLNTQKVNANNEVAIAEQNTQKYIDNYLKAQGFYGSGMGASIGMGSINQANQLRNQNTLSFNQALNEYQQTYNTNQQNQAITNIDAMVNSGKTKEEIEEYLKSYQNDKALSSETQKYIQDYLDNISGATSWTTDRDTAVNGLAQLITQQSDPATIGQLQQIAQKLYNAKTQEEYNSALDEYEKYVNNQALGGQTTEDVINSNNSNNINNITSVKDFYDKMDTGIMVGATSNGKQDSYVNSFLEQAKQGNLKNNIIIDVNYGGGNTYIYYTNGTFYKLGSSIPDNYKKYPTYDEKNISSAFGK